MQCPRSSSSPFSPSSLRHSSPRRSRGGGTCRSLRSYKGKKKMGPRTRESEITSSHRRIVRVLMAVALTLGGVQGVNGQQTPAGEAVMAWPVTIAPTWFDPSTAPPQITPFGMLYALHDALVRPLPGQKMGNSLAESWTESPDGTHVRGQAAPRPQGSQRRPRHRRGREIQLRAL